MPYFILDEWLWHDLGGQNYTLSQCESFTFLHFLIHRTDRIIVVRESKFDRKSQALARSQDVVHLRVSRIYQGMIFRDSTHCLPLNLGDLNDITPELAGRVNPD